MAEQMIADLDASGIYQIRNRKNGKRYVGSAICFRKRWLEHRRDLDRKTHHSVALQRSWDKYGQESFEFLILELCQKEELIVREQFHIDQGGQYNICRIAGSSLGLRHSQEAKERMREAQLKRTSSPDYVSPTKGRKYSQEICERMAAPKRGRKLPPRSPEWCRKIAEAKKGISRNVGRKASDETKQKLREANLGKKKTLAERQALAKVEHSVVSKILQLRLEKMTYRQIAKATDTNHVAVKRICLRERYEWVDPHIPALTTDVIGRGGYRQSAEQRRKISETRRLKRKEAIESGALVLPLPKSEEEKTKSRSLATKAAWAKRKAAGLKKRTFTQEHRQAISRARTKMFESGYKTPERSQETRSNLSAAAKKKWQSEEYREKVTQKIKESHDADRRKLTSAQCSSRWENEEYRNHMKLAIKASWEVRKARK